MSMTELPLSGTLNGEIFNKLLVTSGDRKVTMNNYD